MEMFLVGSIFVMGIDIWMAVEGTADMDWGAFFTAFGVFALCIVGVIIKANQQ